MSLAPAFDLKESHATEGQLARSSARPQQAEPCLSVPCVPCRAERQPVLLPLGADSAMRSASHPLSNSQRDGPVPQRLPVSGHLAPGPAASFWVAAGTGACSLRLRVFGRCLSSGVGRSPASFGQSC